RRGLGRGGLVLRGEERVAVDRELEDAVGELGDQAGAEQAPEVPTLQDDAQIGDEGHAHSLVPPRSAGHPRAGPGGRAAYARSVTIEERVVLVDAAGRAVGSAPKSAVHGPR